MIPIGFYIHIPFCVRKCPYCDFVSYPGKEQYVGEYFEALRQELNWYLQHNLSPKETPCTLYVGGGTPSLVTDELVRFLGSYRDPLTCELFPEKTIDFTIITDGLTSPVAMTHSGDNTNRIFVVSNRENFCYSK